MIKWEISVIHGTGNVEFVEHRKRSDTVVYYRNHKWSYIFALLADQFSRFMLECILTVFVLVVQECFILLYYFIIECLY